MPNYIDLRKKDLREGVGEGKKEKDEGKGDHLEYILCGRSPICV